MVEEESIVRYQKLMARIVTPAIDTIKSVEDIKEKLTLVSHYTSLTSAKNIFSSGEIWFSNPQFMNDLQELNYGISQGLQLVFNSPYINDALKGDQRTWFVKHRLASIAQEFSMQHAPDVYVFCLTAHDDISTPDGLLSMWRAYGAPGQGVALVFKTDMFKDAATSPLLLAEISYATTLDFGQLLVAMLNRWKVAVESLGVIELTDEDLVTVAHSLFICIKVFALTTKHAGFSEEREWRLTYMPDHDPKSLLASRFSYHIGERGIEPKLKLPIAPVVKEQQGSWTFDSILDKIIVGPGMVDHLHRRAIERLLADTGRASFCSRLRFSGIPLRT